MATPNRWAVREAGECSFYSLVNGKAIVTLKTLKTSGVQTTGETVYARGGRGNSKLVGFSSNREATISLEDAIFDNEALGMLTGNIIAAGAKVVDKNELVTVTTDSATLTKTPVGDLTSVYVVNPDGTNGLELTLTASVIASGEYEITGKEITLFAGEFADGEKIRVYYEVTTDITAKTLRVTSDAFGGSFRVVLDCLVRDEFTKQDFEAQIRIPNAKFEDNFDFSFVQRAS